MDAGASARLENAKSLHIYAAKYMRNSKSTAALWIIFTICYAIIAVVAFVTPEWIADAADDNSAEHTHSSARLGLWQICQRIDLFETCNSQLNNNNLFSFTTWQQQLAAPLLMLVAITFALLSIFFLAFLCFANSLKIFRLCAWVQLISVCFMAATCAVYPFSWSHDDFRKICGPESADFRLGLCELRWAYPLTVINCVDGIILATLAFLLAARHVPNMESNKPMYLNSYYKDNVSLNGSRKLLNLQPILLVASPQAGDDATSQFSSRTANNYHHATSMI